MPDVTKKTISATQSPALWGVSPYYTRWMLWQHFANGVDLDQNENSRMSWGKKLQPLVIAQAAQDMRFEVQENNSDIYHRRGLLGCTRDATIICPDRGPGALETKCVFDYGTWMRDWDGGKTIPRQHEIQLQQQMKVGDDSGSYKWGVICAWVGGNQFYFEREPIAELWDMLDTEAEDFFASVRNKEEPNPFGAPIEIPWFARLFPTVDGKVLDLSQDPAANKIAEKVSLYKYLKGEESGAKKAAETLRAELLAIAKDNEEVTLPYGVKVKVSTRNVAAQTRKASVSQTLTVYVPDDGSGVGAKSNPGRNVYAG